MASHNWRPRPGGRRSCRTATAPHGRRRRRTGRGQPCVPRRSTPVPPLPQRMPDHHLRTTSRTRPVSCTHVLLYTSFDRASFRDEMDGIHRSSPANPGRRTVFASTRGRELVVAHVNLSSLQAEVVWWWATGYPEPPLNVNLLKLNRR